MVKPKPQKKKIVILGAGFAGLCVAQQLSKMELPSSYSIVLIDELNVHTYTPELYEVATTFGRKTPQITFPIQELVTQNIQVIQNEIKKIDIQNHRVLLKKSESVTYDFLVVALGSVPNFFDIPGLETHALCLKSIEDAIEIHEKIENTIKLNSLKKLKPSLIFTIGGGGATGIGLASELAQGIRSLTQKYRYPHSKIKIQLIEASPDLVNLGARGTKHLQKAFQKQKIEIHLNTRITKLNEKHVWVKQEDTKKKLDSTLFIWTGGVKVNPITARDLGNTERKGAVEVSEYLQTKSNPKIFAAGDNAFLEDPRRRGKRIPMLAQIAYSQGKIIAHNIYSQIHKGTLKSYHGQPSIVVIPIGEHKELAKIGPFFFKGRVWGWFKRLVFLKYLISIMPMGQALKHWKN